MPLGPALGRYFHILNQDGRPQYQGRIIGRRRHGWFVVQFFEWTMGDPTDVEEVHRDAMDASWMFYEFGFQMRGAYEAQKQETAVEGELRAALREEK